MCAQQCFLIFLVAFSHDMHLTGHRMPLRPQVSAGEHEEALQVLGEAGFIDVYRVQNMAAVAAETYTMQTKPIKQPEECSLTGSCALSEVQ
jgi:hypothetical protein